MNPHQQTHYYQMALAAQALQGLSFLHSEGAKLVFSEITQDSFIVDWYSCDKNTAANLLALLQSAKFYQTLRQNTPEIMAICPKEMNQAFDNLYISLIDYEMLLQKLSVETLSESRIETEILKAAMFYNRERMSDIYLKHYES